MQKYSDRKEAGLILANFLQHYAQRPDVVVLGLPRGGVPVAYEVAQALSLTLDVFIVRKLGVLGYEELAMGAIASGGLVIFNERLMQSLHIDKAAVDSILDKEKKELARREQLYRSARPFPDLAGKTVIVVDDGIATGATMQAAVKAIDHYKPAAIIIAVPVAARSTCVELAPLVKEIVCPLQPIDFYAVGLWYDNFAQTTDEEVIAYLAKATW